MAPVRLKTRDFSLRSGIFREKVRAVPTGSLFGDCSSCIFRNIERYCEELRPVCSCISSDTDDLCGAVYWTANFGGYAYDFLVCQPPVWGRRFFEKTSLVRIRKIASQMVYDALCQENRK